MGDNIPYGSDERYWNQDDKNAPISNIFLKGTFMSHGLIDLSMESITDNQMEDVSKNTNFGILIDDYDIDFEGVPLELKPKKPKIKTKISKKNRGKSY